MQQRLSCAPRSSQNGIACRPRSCSMCRNTLRVQPCRLIFGRHEWHHCCRGTSTLPQPDPGRAVRLTYSTVHATPLTLVLNISRSDLFIKANLFGIDLSKATTTRTEKVIDAQLTVTVRCIGDITFVVDLLGPARRQSPGSAGASGRSHIPHMYVHLHPLQLCSFLRARRELSPSQGGCSRLP